MSFKFNPNQRPEDNIVNFLNHIKGIDSKLGEFVEDNIDTILELREDKRSKSELRTAINTKAIQILIFNEGDELGE